MIFKSGYLSFTLLAMFSISMAFAIVSCSVKATTLCPSSPAYSINSFARIIQSLSLKLDIKNTQYGYVSYLDTEFSAFFITSFSFLFFIYIISYIFNNIN